MTNLIIGIEKCFLGYFLGGSGLIGSYHSDSFGFDDLVKGQDSEVGHVKEHITSRHQRDTDHDSTW